jgi:3alpha(or 20beta)-hydroxysteroid dehydrogenase
MGRLNGKRAIVTGAAMGMGEAVARLFAEEGARVVVADIDENLGNEVAKSIGESATFMKLDVTDPENWAEVVSRTASELGGLDILINNAGVYTRFPIQGATEEEFDRVFSINERGVFLGMKIAAPELRKSGRGAIVNTSSIGGLRGGIKLISYTNTKFAIRGLTRAAAHDLGEQNIRVNAVLPGAIITPMFKANNTVERSEGMRTASALKRLGDAREVAQAHLFLASDDASYVTGTELIVDGGLMA